MYKRQVYNIHIDTNSTHGLILLTYKGKILLSHTSSSPIDQEDHPWRLLGGKKDKKESYEAAMQRLVKKEMGIKVENITSVKEAYFCAQLTDENVNNIERSDNQLFTFFTLKEVEKLFLSLQTREFINHYKSIEPQKNFL